MKIVIVDYGMGNTRSLRGALSYLGQDNVEVASCGETILSAKRLILPGVGNFGSAMANIASLNLKSVLQQAIIDESIPVLGICLGMQLLCRSSTESGLHDGLNLFDADVTHLGDIGLPVPHVGFNQVRSDGTMRLFSGIANDSDFYFTHSYKMDAGKDSSLAHCSYGVKFACGFEQGNIAGVQFHPELSQKSGLRIINNFLELF